jgi:hypothetical protein
MRQGRAAAPDTPTARALHPWTPNLLMPTGSGKTVQSPLPWPSGLPLASGRCAAPHPCIDWRGDIVVTPWRCMALHWAVREPALRNHGGAMVSILNRLIVFKVRTLRYASGAGRRPRHPHGQGVTPLDPESPHAYWQRQNRAVSAPLA